MKNWLLISLLFIVFAVSFQHAAVALAEDVAQDALNILERVLEDDSNDAGKTANHSPSNAKTLWEEALSLMNSDEGCDYKVVFPMLEDAAKQGSTDAMFCICSDYYHEDICGKSVSKEIALSYCKKGASSGCYDCALFAAVILEELGDDQWIIYSDLHSRLVCQAAREGDENAKPQLLNEDCDSILSD